VRQEEVPGEQVGHCAVGQDRRGERRAQGGRRAERLPPTAAGHDQVDHRGHDQRLAHLSDRGRGSEHDPGCDGAPPADGRTPEQDREPRHDQCLEPGARHDGLLGLHLVGVEQDRRDGGRGEPPRDTAPQQQQVDDHGHGQAKQMLNRRDRVEVGEEKDRPQRALVADRVHTASVIQIPGGIDVEQRRTVGELGQQAEHQAGGQQRGGQPVPPQDRGNRGTTTALAARPGPPVLTGPGVLAGGRHLAG